MSGEVRPPQTPGDFAEELWRTKAGPYATELGTTDNFHQDAASLAEAFPGMTTEEAERTLVEGGNYLGD